MRKLSACGWHQCSESGSDLLRPIDGGQWTEPGSLSRAEVEDVKGARGGRRKANEEITKAWKPGAGGVQQAGSSLGTEPRPLQWKHRVLATRPPGKSYGGSGSRLFRNNRVCVCVCHVCTRVQ